MKKLFYIKFSLLFFVFNFIVCMEDSKNLENSNSSKIPTLLVLTAIALAKVKFGYFKSKDFSEGIKSFIRDAISNPNIGLDEKMAKLSEFKKLLMKTFSEEIELIISLNKCLCKLYWFPDLDWCSLVSQVKMSPLMVAASVNPKAVKTILDMVDFESRRKILLTKSQIKYWSLKKIVKQDKTCLMFALENGCCLESLKIILEAADIDIKKELFSSKDKFGQNILMVAAQKPKCVEIIEFILKQIDIDTLKNTLNEECSKGKTVLAYFDENVFKKKNYSEFKLNEIRTILAKDN